MQHPNLPNLTKLLEFFECISPEDYIWNAGRILHHQFGEQKLVFWLVTEQTGELRVFHVERCEGLHVGDLDAKTDSLAAQALQSGRAAAHAKGGHELTVAALLGPPGGPRFVIEIRDIDARGALAASWPFVLSLMAKAYLVAAGAVEQELRYQQVFQSAATLRRKLETCELERKTYAEAAQKASQTVGQMQEQLVQSQKLAMLGQVAAGVAHEINNPLSYANTNTLLAARAWKKVQESLEDGGHTSAAGADLGPTLDDAVEGMRRVMAIVRDLKAFAHKRQDEVATVDIHEVIDRTLAIAMSPFKHRITIEKDYCQEDAWQCDPQALSQVIMNLVVNGAQAIEGTGTIRIATQVVNGNFQVAIADSGRGMPEAVRNRIFEPFFTTKAPGEGTGLGLSTCLELVKRNRGELRCDSREGQGTKFTLLLPRGVEAKPAVERRVETQAHTPFITTPGTFARRKNHTNRTPNQPAALGGA